jgi:hypothetical protein
MCRAGVAGGGDLDVLVALLADRVEAEEGGPVREVNLTGAQVDVVDPGLAEADPAPDHISPGRLRASE